MVSINRTLQNLNFTASMTSVSAGVNRRFMEYEHNIATVFILCVKGLSEKCQKTSILYNIRTVPRITSTLHRHLWGVMPTSEEIATKNYICYILCSCGKDYKAETSGRKWEYQTRKNAGWLDVWKNQRICKWMRTSLVRRHREP